MFNLSRLTTASEELTLAYNQNTEINPNSLPETSILANTVITSLENPTKGLNWKMAQTKLLTTKLVLANRSPKFPS